MSVQVYSLLGQTVGEEKASFGGSSMKFYGKFFG